VPRGRSTAERYDEALAGGDADALARLCANDVEVEVDGLVTRGLPGALTGLIAAAATARSAHDTLEIREDGLIVAIRRTSRAPDAHDAQLAALIQQEAALRRLAELAARGASREEVFHQIVVEGSGLLGTALLTLSRFDPDRVATVVALHGVAAGYGVGTRHPARGGGVLDRVLSTGRPARVVYSEVHSEWAERSAWRGFSAAIGAPIHVDGQLWGAITASAREEALPASMEGRLATFAELLGPAIAGAQARAELLGLVDEQAALRRVAELVARGSSQETLFSTVAEEASRLADGDGTTLLRLDPDGAGATVVAVSGPAPEAVGTTLTAGSEDAALVAEIVRTRAPARIDDRDEDRLDVRSSVGVPIIVDDALWGILAFSTWDHELPQHIERRLQQFAELVAAALANAQARADVQALADEQAALRRVAELVARGVRPEEVFAAVTEEASQLLGAPMTLTRIDGDTLVVVATLDGPKPVGWTTELGPTAVNARVRDTGRAVRSDDYAADNPDMAAEVAMISAVGAPINIGGQVWGVLGATSTTAPLPPGTEDRLTQFAELVAAAIANAGSRAALAASRARVMATADEVRRRIQRDVHDGAQQRLVHTVLALKLAQQQLPEGDDHQGLTDLVAEALEQAQKAALELSDVVRGILPAALTRGGLRAGLESLVGDLPVPVDLVVDTGRLGADVETTAYFVAAEALTNVVKHAHADRAAVSVATEDGRLVVEVRDDGVGGADAAGGTGITGLFDRVDAAGGTLVVSSPPGAGTTVRATLPLRTGAATSAAPSRSASA
jgi:signal transduction histidine kinase